MKNVLTILLAFCFTSCATMFKSSNDIVYIDSNVRKADVIIDGKLIGQTPFNGEIKKNSSTTITIKKDGYQSKTIVADTSIEPFFWLNVAFYYFSSFAATTDLSTGAMYKYSPASFNIDLDPSNN